MSEAPRHLSNKDTTPLETPKGMGDLLPPEAAARRSLSLRVLRTFELRGYQLVTPPVFEHADVVQRGNDALESRDLLRFVEPESGEVAVLRPDITPQVARIVATHLADRPPPFRLCYEGRIFRRQRGRARNHRQVTQAGIECVGLPGVDGDTEVVSLAIAACEDVGLREFRIELSDIRLVRSLLEALPDEARAPVSALLAQKDVTSLRAVLHNRGVSRAQRAQLEALLQHYGDRDVLDSAEKTFRGKDARAALRSLRDITEHVSDLGFGARLCFDLSETRGLSYYTGMHFSVLARGPGEALGGGGRYDNLLGRFHFPAPATGFAIDLGNLQWTLRETGHDFDGDDVRVVVAGGDARALAVAARLREADLACAVLPDGDAKRHLAFARSWGYDAVLSVTGSSLRLLRVADESSHRLGQAAPDLIRRLARSPKKPTRG
jgi:ATP phosphoribosyltransferase regulatory subunit